jgi:hypothetical protein
MLKCLTAKAKSVCETGLTFLLHLSKSEAVIPILFDTSEEKLMSRSIEQSKAIVQSMITLASAALGLVCALAWNEAIKSAMKEILGEDDSVAGLFTYAILATILAVVVLLVLARSSAKIGGDAAIDREAEG